MPSRARLVTLWISTGVAAAGSTVVFLVVPWFVLATTGSATRVGIVTAAELCGLVVSSAVGGPLVDRLGVRRTALTTDILGAATVALIPLLHATVGLAFWQLVVLAVVLGVNRAPGETAREVLVPELVVDAGTPLERGAGGIDAATRAARMLGAPLAGAALLITGPPVVLAADAALFLLAAGLLAVATPTKKVGSARCSAGYARELREGLRCLRGDRLLAAVLLMLLFTNTFDMATQAVLAPVYAREILYSPAALGAITGVMGGAAVLGNVLYTWLGPRFPRRPVFLLSFLVAGAPRYVLLALQPGLVGVLLAVGLVALAAGAINPILAVTAFERIPPELRGRVLGLTQTVAQGATPLGALIGGLVVDGAGLLTTLWITAGCYLLVTLAPTVFSVWHQLDRAGDRARRRSPVPD